MGRTEKLLIANRGEIALRILRTARGMGLATVAVHSDADRDAPHVTQADEAVCLGPAPAAESYLNAERLLDAAQHAGADAIHPGYGFLSESAAFAQSCADAGLTFIGPPPAAIAAMGNKAEAKRLMEKAGVPCVPGYHGTDQTDAALTAAAAEIGYPVMVKAAAGGGGKGMRVVRRAAGLSAALDRARSEAAGAFGSDELILEKAVAAPRHVEVQILADGHGKVLHLGERDCSVQRRHQKIIEEAPGPAVTAELRAALGTAAVKAAKAISYANAGTVEFLLDAEGNFYFLEMNTRLQVEHPVTELITGLDLVSWQIRVAEGEGLPFAQKDIAFNGHAIEARLYAEDPASGFLPAAGRIDHLHLPEAPGLRIDHALAAGQDVTPHYDPLLAKLIAWGETRDQARRRLARALRGTHLSGPATNRDFLVRVLTDDRFAAGEATTSFLEGDAGRALTQPPAPAVMDRFLAAILLHLGPADNLPPGGETFRNWSSSGRSAFTCRFGAEAEPVMLDLTGRSHYSGRLDGEDLSLDVLEHRANQMTFSCCGHRHSVYHHFPARNTVVLDRDGRTMRFTNTLLAPPGAAEGAVTGEVLAPMHGRVRDILVRAGAKVARGDRLLVLEAMKMEHDVLAPVAGEVTGIFTRTDEQVPGQARLMTIQPAE